MAKTLKSASVFLLFLIFILLLLTNSVFLGGNLITWSSKKQHVVARSSAEAEYRSLAQASTDIIWVNSLLQELGLSVVRRPVLWCDNQSAAPLAKNPVFHARTKHIEIDVHFLHEKVAAGVFDICYVPTEFQIADIFTKNLAVDRFVLLRTKLNLVRSPMSSLWGNVKTASLENLSKTKRLSKPELNISTKPEINKATATKAEYVTLCATTTKLGWTSEPDHQSRIRDCD